MYINNIVFQTSHYVGILLDTIFYGVELVIYSASVRIILRGKANGMPSRGSCRLLFFSTGLLLPITLWVVSQAALGQDMWIAHPVNAEGSPRYLGINVVPMWYEIVGCVASLVLNTMSDGLLLYRCYIVWGDGRVIILPFIIYLATMSLGVLAVYVSDRPQSILLFGASQRLVLAYVSVGISLNFLVSTLICVRILLLAKRLEVALGEEAAHTYTNTATLIIESALPYTLSGLAYLVALGMQSSTSILFMSIYVMFACLSPQMIVFRVLMGHAWTRDAVTRSTASVLLTTAIVYPGAVDSSVEPGTGHWRATIELRTVNDPAFSTIDQDVVASKV
ncbi:hypothetical protein BD309DRAFT_1017388 [Dichomitus squalens]|uniref:Uncharacterized protein n=1 Tax=Dichomitus squalens TaxID=114155 RepID=A0A4Q9NWA3_9APHY|nr:hypothetical protein BD309DRAFT_1017388 [Dichomitus squalens]TBU60300.1 hypothetical protein BD310DRAFT_1005413 [Dichomitus squalens]